MPNPAVANEIWNRACKGGGDSPRAGDRALAALPRFHGAAMNGGVLHAAEYLSSVQLLEAKAGYCYFGYESVADLVVAAEKAILLEQDLDNLEEEFDQQYHAKIPNDGALASRFEYHLKANYLEYLLPVA